VVGVRSREFHDQPFGPGAVAVFDPEPEARAHLPGPHLLGGHVAHRHVKPAVPKCGGQPLRVDLPDAVNCRRRHGAADSVLWAVTCARSMAENSAAASSGIQWPISSMTSKR